MRGRFDEGESRMVSGGGNANVKASRDKEVGGFMERFGLKPKGGVAARVGASVGVSGKVTGTTDILPRVKSFFREALAQYFCSRASHETGCGR